MIILDVFVYDILDTLTGIVDEDVELNVKGGDCHCYVTFKIFW